VRPEFGCRRFKAVCENCVEFHVVATVLLEREIQGPGAEVSEMERQTGT
jgi:hypothetical protein